MTLRFAESFDWITNSVNSAQLALRGYAVNNTPGFQRSAGRLNGFALFASGISDSGYDLNHSLGGSYSSGCFGTSIQATSTYGLGYRIVRLNNGTTTHLAVRLETDGRLSVLRDTTVLAATPSPVVALGFWHRVELKFSIHDTAGSYELRVDGAIVLSATGADTRNGTTADVDRFALHGTGNTPALSFDDITFNDLTGATNNDFLGDLHIEQLRPSSDVAVGWTRSAGAANYATVDDVGLDTTDYVTAAAAATDTYGLTDLSDNPTQVMAVQALYHASKDNTGVCTMRSRVVSGASTGDGATVGLNTAAVVYSDLFEADPQGGAAWTGARVNAAQLSIERVS